MGYVALFMALREFDATEPRESVFVSPDPLRIMTQQRHLRPPYFLRLDPLVVVPRNVSTQPPPLRLAALPHPFTSVVMALPQPPFLLRFDIVCWF